MKKKKLIRHPFLLNLFSISMVLLVGGAIMLHLDKTYDIPEYINIIVGISLTLISFTLLLLFVKNFGQLLKREAETRIEKIKTNAFSNKSFVLIQQRSVFANFVLVFGFLAIFIAWVIFLPVESFNAIGFWIFRIISILVTILGAIFSFVTPKKMLTYKNGELKITTDTKTLSIKPSQLIDYKKEYSYPNDKNKFRKEFYVDLILILDNNEQIILKNTDIEISFKYVLAAVKQIELENKNSKLKNEN